jgi:hypothetical protein
MRRDHSDLVRTASLTAFNATNRRSYRKGVSGGSIAIASFLPSEQRVPIGRPSCPATISELLPPADNLRTLKEHGIERRCP